MTARLKGRRREVARLLGRFADWAATDRAVEAVILVGSYARGAERMASDVDVVIVTSDPDRLARSDSFAPVLRGAVHLRDARWGPVRERRYRLPSGLQVEIDLAPREWLAIPLDAGTERVLRDGYRVVYDQNGRMDATGVGAR
ncbi:nucleotidyltransferase domain-containing protein [Leifsonia sp. 22587]|uniref:nucleotidyltransferase domain-containing protein n=1 Tax=Leifsonia sp. 22587 TaxID=3453946 RepID=UPI003F85ED39